MGLTFTIGAQTCAALAGGAGVFALAFDADSEHHNLMRHHIPGVAGNYVVRPLSSGTPIRCKFRIVNTLANVWSTYAALKAAWKNTAITIVGTDATYLRCSLNPGGLKIVRQPVAKGDGTNVFMDCEATFLSDA